MRRHLLLVLVGAVASLNASALLAQEDGIRERYDAFNAAFGAADTKGRSFGAAPARYLAPPRS